MIGGLKCTHEELTPSKAFAREPCHVERLLSSWTWHVFERITQDDLTISYVANLQGRGSTREDELG